MGEIDAKFCASAPMGSYAKKSEMGGPVWLYTIYLSNTAAREVKPARDIPDLSRLKIELS